MKGSCCPGTESLSVRLPVWSHCRHRGQKGAGPAPSYAAVPSYMANPKPHSLGPLILTCANSQSTSLLPGTTDL